MFAKSRVLELIGLGSRIPQTRHEWISLAPPAITVTGVASGTTIDGSATLLALEVSAADALLCPPGTRLKNASRATPIGTYKVDEVMEVVTVTGAVLTLKRAINGDGTNGSDAHAATDLFRIMYSAKQEGSKATDDPNLYKSQTILENYSAIQSMKLEATGSQMARAMEVVASDFERQYQRELIQLKNQMVNMVLYGNDAATEEGSDTVIRDTKGVLQFMVDNINAANPLIDYTSTALTATPLNTLFRKLWENGADPSDNYIIVTSGQSKQVLGGLDASLVRTTYEETRLGKEVTMFHSDMGFAAEVIADPLIPKSDLFILNPNKLSIIPFRPFEKEEWGKGTSTPNGDDIYYQRTLGEHLIEVIDPGHAHAAMTFLSWL